MEGQLSTNFGGHLRSTEVRGSYVLITVAGRRDHLSTRVSSVLISVCEGGDKWSQGQPSPHSQGAGECANIIRIVRGSQFLITRGWGG
jgi:hypothetical protein